MGFSTLYMKRKLIVEVTEIEGERDGSRGRVGGGGDPVAVNVF